MRRIGFVFLAIATLVASSAYAQDGPPGPPKPPTDVTKAMLDIAAKIGAAALKPGVSVSDRNIALSDTGNYNVTVAYVTRPASKVMSGIGAGCCCAKSRNAA